MWQEIFSSVDGPEQEVAIISFHQFSRNLARRVQLASEPEYEKQDMSWNTAEENE